MTSKELTAKMVNWDMRMASAYLVYEEMIRTGIVPSQNRIRMQEMRADWEAARKQVMNQIENLIANESK